MTAADDQTGARPARTAGMAAGPDLVTQEILGLACETLFGAEWDLRSAAVVRDRLNRMRVTLEAVAPLIAGAAGTALQAEVRVLRDRVDGQAWADLTAERDRLAEQVQQVRVVAVGAGDAIAELLALPAVREEELRNGLAEVVRIQATALAALDGGAS